jgi:hypothetical protein
VLVGDGDSADPLRRAYEALLRGEGLDLVLEDRPRSFPDDLVRDDQLDVKAAGELIRQLESERGYDSFEGVGTEPVADYLYRLGTIRRRRGPYLAEHLRSLQAVIDDQWVELGRWLRPEAGERPWSVMPGIFPTGELNARVHPVPGEGGLVLVNSGLMDLFFAVLKINMASAGFKGAPPLLNEGQTAMVLADAINAYLFGGGAFEAQPLPPLPPERVPIVGFLLRRAEQFVVAHELGHLAAGHVDPRTAAAYHADPDNELAADAFAVSLLARSVADEPAGRRHDVVRYLAGGVSLFFHVALVTEIAWEALGRAGTSGDSHPPTRARRDAAFTRMEELWELHRPLELPIALGLWFERALPSTIDWLRRVDEIIDRPGRYG